MQELYKYLEKLEYLEKFFSSIPGHISMSFLLIIATSLIIKGFRRQHRKKIERESSKQEAVKLQGQLVRRVNLTYALMVIVILALWSNQISGFVLSVAALCGAMLITSKELILSFWGSVMFSFNRSFHIGDYLEIGEYQGRVVNVGFFSIELAEIGPSMKQTGRILTLPTNLIILHPVKNLSITAAMGLHLIKIHLPVNSDFAKIEEMALRIANQVCKDFVEHARASFRRFDRSVYLETPSPEPEAFLTSINEKCVSLTLRISCPVNRRGQTEQLILKEFWKEYGRSIFETSKNPSHSEQSFIQTQQSKAAISHFSQASGSGNFTPNS